jgi:hypothetical protein
MAPIAEAEIAALGARILTSAEICLERVAARQDGLTQASVASRRVNFGGIMQHGSYPTTAKNYLRRNAGCRGLLIYCSDYRCSHWIAINADRWADDARLSDLEQRFVCKACGRKGADVRPDFDCNRKVPVDDKLLRGARDNCRPLFGKRLAND